MRIGRLDDYRLPLRCHRLLWRAFKTASILRALTHNLDGVENRLRVVNYNDHLRVYVNGALVSSVRDSKFTYGTVGIVLENSGSDVKFALSDLELREAVEIT